MLTVPGARCVEFVKGIHQGDMRLGTGKGALTSWSAMPTDCLEDASVKNLSLVTVRKKGTAECVHVAN